MNKSRRDFIKFGVLSAAFAGTNLFEFISASAQSNIAADSLTLSEPLTDLFSSQTATEFRQYIGAEFLLLQDRGAVSIILSEVTEAPKIAQSGERSGKTKQSKSTAKNFVLSFQVPTAKFPQETYHLWHPDLGQFDLFLVPEKCVAPFLMHAVINRL